MTSSLHLKPICSFSCTPPASLHRDYISRHHDALEKVFKKMEKLTKDALLDLPNYHPLLYIISIMIITILLMLL